MNSHLCSSTISSAVTIMPLVLSIDFDSIIPKISRFRFFFDFDKKKIFRKKFLFFKKKIFSNIFFSNIFLFTECIRECIRSKKIKIWNYNQFNKFDCNVMSYLCTTVRAMSSSDVVVVRPCRHITLSLSATVIVLPQRFVPRKSLAKTKKNRQNEDGNRDFDYDQKSRFSIRFD